MFKVEDGTGLTDSNAYCTVEYADDYFSLRNNEKWQVLTQPVKEAYIVQATDYIDLIFGDRFIGKRVNDSQALKWPRTGLNTPIALLNNMPIVLLRACCEYALRAANGALLPDPQLSPSGYAIQSESKLVGPLNKSITYAVKKGTVNEMILIKPYPAADKYLTTLLLNSARRVIR